SRVESMSGSYVGRIAPPGMPKTTVVPTASSERTIAWAPVIVSPCVTAERATSAGVTRAGPGVGGAVACGRLAAGAVCWSWAILGLLGAPCWCVAPLVAAAGAAGGWWSVGRRWAAVGTKKPLGRDGWRGGRRRDLAGVGRARA